MKILSLLFAAVVLIIAESILKGQSFRVTELPNGSKFSCNTCHTDGGGTPRNSFGIEVETNYLTVPGPGGHVEWGPDLAALDSDGDGFTNGEELNDPNGTWTQNDDQPGNINDVTNPGDSLSAPTTGIFDVTNNPADYSLANNYPNPFNPSTTIEFNIGSSEYVTLEIYNSLGEKVKTLASGIFPMGRHSLKWDATDDSGNKVNSGIYIYRITTENYVNTKRMLLLK